VELQPERLPPDNAEELDGPRRLPQHDDLTEADYWQMFIDAGYGFDVVPEDYKTRR